MVTLNVCYCVGKYKFTGKENKEHIISYFTYNLPEKNMGQGCFQTFDDCEIGKSYNFVMSNYKPVLVK